MRTGTVLFAVVLLIGCSLKYPPDPKIEAVTVTQDQSATVGCKLILNIEAWSDKSLTALKGTEIDRGIYGLKREAYRVGANLVLRGEAVKEGTRWHIKGKAYRCPGQEPAPALK